MAAVILDTVRLPFGKKNGALRSIRPDSLLTFAIQGLVNKTGIAKEAIDDVIAGCVTQTGEQGANIGRLGALLADFPVSVPGVAINRMCGSSQQAVHFAAQAVLAGDARYVIAGGVESMTRVPMFADIAGNKPFVDFGMLNPDLLVRHELIAQGESAKRIAKRYNLSRQMLDDFAAKSHEKAALSSWLAPSTSFASPSLILRIMMATKTGKGVLLPHRLPHLKGKSAKLPIALPRLASLA